MQLRTSPNNDKAFIVLRQLISNFGYATCWQKFNTMKVVSVTDQVRALMRTSV